MLMLDKNGQSLYEQLFKALRRSIIKGELQKNQALKPIRVLSEELHISNNTVSRAYQQLLDEGYIRSVQGSGYYVENLSTLPNLNPTVRNMRGKMEPDPEPASGPGLSVPLKYDFRYDKYESSFFPWSKWRKYMQEAILMESCRMEIGYECNKGSKELRESLCKYLNSSRGVKCNIDQIVISSGTQYAMDIIMELLHETVKTVGVEDPSFTGMQQIFKNKGYSIRSLPMTELGIDIHTLESSECDLLYLTPSHQFPTGVTTSMNERIRILEWAKKSKAYIIENDYDNEFLYGEKPIPSIQSLSNRKNAVYLSTLSKVLSPSVRCAYFVLPEDLLKIYEEKYKYYYSALATCNQTALASFIKDGHLDRHVRKISMLNKKKYDIFKKVIFEQLSGIVNIYPTPAGSHTLIQIPGCNNQELLIERMKLKGIGIYGTKVYWQDQRKAPEDILLFGFNSIPEEEMEAACTCFARILKELDG